MVRRELIVVHGVRVMDAREQHRLGGRGWVGRRCGHAQIVLLALEHIISAVRCVRGGGGGRRPIARRLIGRVVGNADGIVFGGGCGGDCGGSRRIHRAEHAVAIFLCARLQWRRHFQAVRCQVVWMGWSGWLHERVHHHFACRRLHTLHEIETFFNFCFFFR